MSEVTPPSPFQFCSRIRCERSFKNLQRTLKAKVKHLMAEGEIGPLEWRPCGQCGHRTCSFHLVTSMLNRTGEYLFNPSICCACVEELHPRKDTTTDWQI